VNRRLVNHVFRLIELFTTGREEKWEERNSKRLAYEIIFFHYSFFFLQCFIDFSAEEDEEGGDIEPKHEDDDGA
jgi:hypothetical protein